MLKPMESARTYQFTITVVVEPAQDGYDCTYGGLVQLPGPDSSTSSSEVTEP